MSTQWWAAHVCAAFFLLASGCAGTSSDSFGGSRTDVETWAAPRGFRTEVIETGNFRLFSLLRQRGAVRTLPIYIEGDGAPWPSAFQPPRDPTPLQPVSLALAARDPAPTVAYLGRPCQYLDEPELAHCDSAYWSGRRFSPEVLAAMDEAIGRLKLRTGAQRIRLIGHSGGGVVVALLALRRDDVADWVTLAAPLALTVWTTAQGLTPLAGSLDPMAQPAAAITRRATHFAGADDAVVPAEIIVHFVGAHGGRLEVLADFDHDCCWVRDWAQLLRRVPSQEGEP